MNLLNVNGQHHPKADVDNLYVPRKQGGRGQIQLEEAYAVEITKLVEYVDSKEDPLRHYSSTPTQHQLSNVTDRCLKTELHRRTRQIKASITKKFERWRGKRMHRQFPRNLDEKLMDNECTSVAKIWRHLGRNRKYSSGS